MPITDKHSIYTISKVTKGGRLHHIHLKRVGGRLVEVHELRDILGRAHWKPRRMHTQHHQGHPRSMPVKHSHQHKSRMSREQLMSSIGNHLAHM